MLFRYFNIVFFYVSLNQIQRVLLVFIDEGSNHENYFKIENVFIDKENNSWKLFLTC